MNGLFWRGACLFNHVANGGIKRERAAREATGSGTYDALTHFYLFAAQRIVAIRHAGCLHRIGDQDQPLSGAAATQLHGGRMNMMAIGDKFQPCLPGG